jgi:hypothetical protein
MMAQAAASMREQHMKAVVDCGAERASVPRAALRAALRMIRCEAYCGALKQRQVTRSSLSYIRISSDSKPPALCHKGRHAEFGRAGPGCAGGGRLAVGRSEAVVVGLLGLARLITSPK